MRFCDLCGLPTAHIGSCPLLGLSTFPFRSLRLSQVLAETLSRLRQAGRRHFFTLPNCWELFGADFLLEAVTARPVFLGDHLGGMLEGKTKQDGVDDVKSDEMIKIYKDHVDKVAT